MVIVGGMGTLIGPVFGAILLTVLPEVLRGFGDLRLVVYGAALTFVVLFMPGGLAQAARVIGEKLGLVRSHMSHSDCNRAIGGAILRAQGLHKNFGGVKAVSDISFEVPAGSIFAVIGPNGAGKSTLLNLISGVYSPMPVRCRSRTPTFRPSPRIGACGLESRGPFRRSACSNSSACWRT